MCSNRLQNLFLRSQPINKCYLPDNTIFIYVIKAKQVKRNQENVYSLKSIIIISNGREWISQWFLKSERLSFY